MKLEHPILLLLMFLIPIVYRHFRLEGHRYLNILRLLILILVVVGLAGPVGEKAGEGVDVIIIADGSASMGKEAREDEKEIVKLVGFSPARSRHDRVAVTGFADGAGVDVQASEKPVSWVENPGLGRNRSELAEGLLLAAVQRSPLRRTRVLVLSDGEYSGKNPLSGDVISALEGIPVWYRYLGRPKTGDVAAESIHIPDQVPAGAGFILRFSISSENDTKAQYTLKKAGQVVAAGPISLKKGSNVFFTRDRAEGEGIVEYGLEVGAEADRISENNISMALLHVTARPRVLLVSEASPGGIIQRSLEKANILVDFRSPGEMSWAAARLVPYKVVILENISMKQLGFRGAQALAGVVENGVCSLLVTGGEYAFGNGGYHRSPLDPLLPVSMEIKQEQRRGMMAVVMVLDRSGSMSMVVPGGISKMDLANQGVAEAIRLLSPLDQVSVIAVDSQAHMILPLAEVDDTTKLVSAVLRIQPMGGGIFVRTGIGGAAEEIRKSGLTNRHILLFADANDSEEQEDTVTLVKELEKEGITTSVIGLGSAGDRDAVFLKDVARAGGGDIYFTSYAEELPRLFSMEIIRVARRGFIKEVTPLSGAADMVQLQVEVGVNEPVVRVNGFNLTSLRQGASCGLVTLDEYRSPVVAFWQQGKARAGAIMVEIDGQYSGEIGKWQHTPEIVVNLVRWLARGMNTAQAKADSWVYRGRAMVRIEFTEEEADGLRLGGHTVQFLPPAGNGVLEAPLTWDNSTTAYAEVSLGELGHYLPVVDMGEEGVLKAPAVSLSYSPEFLPGSEIDGAGVLESLAQMTGGKAMVKVDELFSEEGLSAVDSQVDMRIWIIFLVLLLLVLEIGEKRLSYSEVVKGWLGVVRKRIRIDK